MSQIKILWVDDEIDLLTPHILFLEKKNYAVTTCNNGQDAIDLFGGRVKDLAEAIGVTSQAISRWPEQLERYHIGVLMEAADRLSSERPGIKRKLAKLMK